MRRAASARLFQPAYDTTSPGGFQNVPNAIGLSANVARTARAPDHGALACAFVFPLVYGYAAARGRRAGRVLLPLLDILQSVPVLGFLSITVTGFIALFPGSLLGLECASIFAVFTSQAWNMTFAFFQ